MPPQRFALPSEAPGLAARRIAADILDGVLHRGRFVWTHASDGVIQLSAAQLSTLLEGIDWRRVHRGGTADGDAPPPTLAA